jgi:hypothetical protein
MNDLPKYEVIVSEQARLMLFEHARFLAQVSVSSAEKLYDRFEERVDSLEIMPERCPTYYNPYIRSRKYRKLSIGYNVYIIFQIQGDKVFIELALDARAKNQRLYFTHGSL